MGADASGVLSHYQCKCAKGWVIGSSPLSMSGKLEHVLLKGMVLVALLAALTMGCSPSADDPLPTPTRPATPTAAPAVTDTPPPTSTSLSLEEAVGQMLLIGFRGIELENDTAALLQEVSPGGVILFDYDGPTQGELPRNIESRDQLRSLIDSLQDQADIPLFVAIDAEGGYVNRLKSEYGFQVTVPSHQELGAMLPSETREIILPLAEELKWLGVNWNLAPVVDVNVNTESPAIGAVERSFGIDPNVVAAHAVAFVEAHSEVWYYFYPEALPWSRERHRRHSPRCDRRYGHFQPICGAGPLSVADRRRLPWDNHDRAHRQSQARFHSYPRNIVPSHRHPTTAR